MVFANPQYPYRFHGYEYDESPGDNDMPWLRAYAQTHLIFQGIDMSLDWKDREWEMIQAIIYYTSHTLHWNETSTISQWHYRALTILANTDACPTCGWGCGDVSAAAVGLAQAQGIPARLIGGIDDDYNGDLCCEMFSTRFNRWIHLFPKGYNWIEQEGAGPLGARDILPHYFAGKIQTQQIDGAFYALPNAPLIFMPNTLNRAPISPFYSERWWNTQFQHLTVTTKNRQNRQFTEPGNMEYVCNDNFYNQWYGYNPPLPIVQLDDLNVAYPLNNVEATAQAIGPSVAITLKNNMFEFVRYEARVDNGAWLPIEEAGLMPDETGLGYTWTPLAPSSVSIRGVNRAGVHSPDIVLRATFPLAGDMTGDGLANGDDVQGFVNALLHPGPPSPARCAADVNGDGVVGMADTAAFINKILGENGSGP
jgi:hypothetical protein